MMKLIKHPLQLKKKKKKKKNQKDNCYTKMDADFYAYNFS